MPVLVEDNFRPCLVICHADSRFGSAAAGGFRRRGWDVYTARSGPEARRLARMLSADLVVLGSELPGESGWLTCAKLSAELSHIEVVLVADGPGPLAHLFAAFAGATALVDAGPGPAALVSEVDGSPLAAR
jgi:DNA-binding response OmpR family regulator